MKGKRKKNGRKERREEGRETIIEVTLQINTLHFTHTVLSVGEVLFELILVGNVERKKCLNLCSVGIATVMQSGCIHMYIFHLYTFK